ncbi:MULTISPECIES: hypothetical protein [Streptomyces]|uniref:Uncharacterized protein n=1 Tax=Streptomyces chartreusis NRRL 3882 TaxID=1079985 RepID=A0A2N9B6K1_STRCX|nr:hypothetical protein [Streptomyces chartreusis]MYS91900.1 hypothetical protein [Streptomyces sp. SID5464]SOR78982.1 hypothetical protein SCNRRL3882_2446 [Streptomyces chartreusis NRRL 3882]
MEPITAGLLVALASGTAGAAGEQIWASLRDLVTRRGRRAGEEEPALPAEPPRTEERAGQLAALLNARARQDPDFAAALEVWRRRADAEAGSRSGDVHNEISGGTQGTVIQGRDIHGNITFGGGSS